MKHKILVVDDEEMMTELLSDHLRDCGYEVFAANSAREAMGYLPKEPELLILDINMPGMDGLEFCRNIRDQVSCPILFLTARVAEQDVVNGLQYGGDDYITKPFSLRELSARVAAHLRRDGRMGKRASVLTSGELLVNLSERKVFYREKELAFSRREFDLVEFLLANAGQVFDRERIYEEVWGFEAEGNADVIKEYVRKIRARLQEASGLDYIETVWGVGYKWKR